LFKLATSWWVAYDKKTNKGAFSNIKNDSKFGRALIVMMRAVGLVFDKTQHYLGALQEETTMNEGKGKDLADKVMKIAAKDVKNLNGSELMEFRKWIAKAFDMKEGKLNEASIDSSMTKKKLLKHMEQWCNGNLGISDKGVIKKVVDILTKASQKAVAKVKHWDEEGKWLTEGTINEREFVIIDPRGNAKPVGMKAQGAQYLKKMGGPRKGYHMVLKKNADKARRAIEKNGGNATNSKIQNIMFDLMYEITESSEQWAKTLKKLAAEKQLKSISSKDKETLLKIVRMVKTANEAKLDKEKFTDPSKMKEKKKKSMILGDKEKTNESQNPLRYPKNK
jgi:hypothetical protein